MKGLFFSRPVPRGPAIALHNCSRCKAVAVISISIDQKNWKDLCKKHNEDFRHGKFDL